MNFVKFAALALVLAAGVAPVMADNTPTAAQDELAAAGADQTAAGDELAAAAADKAAAADTKN